MRCKAVCLTNEEKESSIAEQVGVQGYDTMPSNAMAIFTVTPSCGVVKYKRYRQKAAYKQKRQFCPKKLPDDIPPGNNFTPKCQFIGCFFFKNISSAPEACGVTAPHAPQTTKQTSICVSVPVPL